MYPKRILSLQDWLRKELFDAFFITNFYNILYLTGLKALCSYEREAYILITRKNIYVFTDGGYFNQFESEITNNKFTNQLQNSNIKIKQISPESGLMKQLQEIVREDDISSFGFEREDVKYSEYDLLKKSLKVELKPLDRIILKIRETKTDAEIEKIEKACEIGDTCLTEIVPCIRPGITEKEIAWNIEKQLRTSSFAKATADKADYELSFDPIVAVDANAALPHYNTKNGGGCVRPDSVILIDFGVKHQNYCSDITRMFFMKDAADEVKKAYLILKEAQQKTIKHLKTGGKLSGADEFCRRMIIDRGFEHGMYPHSTGHGIGLEVHEYPKVSANSTDTVSARQVFTIEPGIYMPGRWGLRVEDTVTVGKEGVIKVLTKYPKI